MSPRKAADKPSGLDARFAILKDLAVTAGAAARSAFRTRPHGDYVENDPSNFLVGADRAIGDVITKAIAEAFPGDAILGAEGSEPGGSFWVVVPIDGRGNFLRGLEHFCTSIAYVEAGRCEFGAVVQPVSGDIWLARRGKGARLNGAPISTNATAITDTAVIELGWARRLQASAYLAAQGRLLQAGAEIRRGGSGTLALAHVADGRSDGYLDAKTPLRDCLAGLLLVREAGGKVDPAPAVTSDYDTPVPVQAAADAEIAGLIEEAMELLTIVEVTYDDR